MDGLLIPTKVTFQRETFTVHTTSGEIIAPLASFPRLYHATAEQRRAYELSPCGIHWLALDEDISVTGLLAGRGDMTNPLTRPHAPNV